MHDLSRRRLLSLIGLAPFASGILTASAASATRATGDETQASARERIRQRYFPDITLRTQDNKPVRFYEDLIKDKIVTINFFYANCEGICPLVTANLVKVQQLLGKRVGRDIFMNSITLKPEEDTPAVLKEYEKMHAIGPGWRLLTGKPGDIERLRKSLGFTYPNKLIDQDKSQHIGNVRYGNEPLMLWAACPGMAHAKWIAESISWVVRS
jgi:protein SCO1/2